MGGDCDITQLIVQTCICGEDGPSIAGQQGTCPEIAQTLLRRDPATFLGPYKESKPMI